MTDRDAPARHAQADGDVPVARVFEVSTGSDSDARVTQRIPATVIDAHGALPVGALCILTDHALGRGLSRVLELDQRMVTSHMHLEIVHPPAAGATHLVGRAEAVHSVPGSGFSRGIVEGPDGTIVALISARFAVFDAANMQGGMVTDVQPVTEPAGATADETPAHPWTDAPIHHLLQTRIVTHAEGRVILQFRANPELANERAGLHGGVGALMGERASELAMRSASPHGDRFRPVELRVVFLRPVPAVGQLLHSDAEVVFLGRSTATTTARLYRADGKVAVQVDAVHVLTAG